MQIRECLFRLVGWALPTIHGQDYLNVLGTLVHEYEQKHKPIPDISGVELLKALIAEFGLRQKD